MDAWWQCEIPYPFVPREVLAAADSVRGSLPNRYCDPLVAADLFEEVIDEFQEEGRRIGEKLLWFLNTSLKSAPQHSRFMPGTAPPEAAPQTWRDRPRGAGAGPNLTDAEKGVAPSAGQNARRLMSLNAEEAMAMGILFVGNPDSVYRQIMEFYDKVGGFGHLGMIGRSGFMTHPESAKGIRLFANEVLPRLKEVKPVEAV